MRNIIIFSIITFVLLAAIFVNSTELRNLVRLKQSEINGLKKANKIERDSLHKLLEVTRKAFKARNDSIIFAHEKTLKANAVSQKEIKKLREIIFIQHTDSSRNAELRNLYPTFKLQ